MTNVRLAPRLRDRLGALLVGPGWRRLALLRRSAAAVLAVAALVLALAPRTGAGGVPLVVTAVDLPAGSMLLAEQLAVREWPADLTPTGAVREVAGAAGRVLVGAARSGEPLTDVRLAGSGLALGGGAGAAAVPVRLADAGVAAVLVPGSRVDVVTVGARTDEPIVLAAAATVLAVLPEDSRTSGRLVLVATAPGQAARVAAAALADQVAITLR
ncbi:SAF domain-containing protein [Pseudonocardia sp.]|jgi:Flp pilus assembly protein CpaB|uniref:SAF domain-containing protein n=1 Tax=Pseudonocardia sp. TaxID=60912 RepID=UPI0031FE1C17